MHRDHFSVHGIDKVWRQLNREGIEIGCDSMEVARLVRQMRLAG